MPAQNLEPLWRERLRKIRCEPRKIRFPDVHTGGLPQDREWCEVVDGGTTRRIRLHDYPDIFDVPGLYEQIFYQRLKCCSPNRVARLLEDVVRDFGQKPDGFRVLDVGAGNGMAGEELHVRGARRMVGIDIIEEAKHATERDRPEIYDEYFVADLTDLPESVEEKLRAENLNCLISVAALGFGDVPPKAFLKALDVIDSPGWLAFNIKEDFLQERDTTGFSRLIRQLNRDSIIQSQALRRYRHRLSIKGKPLYYVAVVAKKLVDVPDHLMMDDA